MSKVTPVTSSAHFRTITSSAAFTVVDFYADWCGPCKQMAPAIDALAAKHQGTLLVAKLNTDKAPRTASGHQIQGIPTVMVFDHGLIVARQSGAMPLAALEQLIASAQGGSSARTS